MNTGADVCDMGRLVDQADEDGVMGAQHGMMVTELVRGG